jgi:hypothetical protein
MKILFLYFSFIFSNYCFSQRIKNFNLYQLSNSVVIKFTLGPGNSCNGWTIYKSLDSIYYNQLYDYPTICGASGSNEEFSYTDNSPALNQINYYKIQLNPGETSPVKRIFLDPQIKATLLAFPNPINNFIENLSLRITGANNIRVVGFLYNQFGNMLHELDLKTIADTTAIRVNDLNNGVYVIWLTDGVAAYATKFIIQR